MMSADLKDKFCFRVLWLSELPRSRERPQTAICYLEWLGSFVSRDLFGCVHVISPYIAKVFSESVIKSFPCFTNAQLFAISAGYAVNDIGGSARKVISNLNRSLGPRHFLYVMNERTSFASWASAFKSSRLFIGLKWTSDQKVAHVFVAFEGN